MDEPVLTEVAAVVAGRGDQVVAAFEALVREPMPDGLMRTELLAGPDDQWRIQSLWRDADALAAMRAGSEPPAAPALFRRLGAEPTLTIWRVRGQGGG